jgi:hypothetical protein
MPAIKKKAMISHSFASHEEGTKAYQLWKLGNNDLGWVTVHQWGKSTAVLEHIGRGGEIKVTKHMTERAADLDFNSMVKKKRGRGYNFEAQEQELVNEDEFFERIEKLFGRTNAAQIRTTFGDGTDVPVFEDEPEPPKLKKQPKPVDDGPRPEGWGTW